MTSTNGKPCLMCKRFPALPFYTYANKNNGVFFLRRCNTFNKTLSTPSNIASMTINMFGFSIGYQNLYIRLEYPSPSGHPYRNTPSCNYLFRYIVISSYKYALHIICTLKLYKHPMIYARKTHRIPFQENNNTLQNYPTAFEYNTPGPMS